MLHYRFIGGNKNTINIKNTNVYIAHYDKNAIYIEPADGSYTTVNISGTSKIGNGGYNQYVDSGQSVSTIRCEGTVKLYLSDSACVYSGEYGGTAITFYGANSILSCTGECRIYALNGRCATSMSSGFRATFNSTGYFYASTGYTCACNNDNFAELNIIKGHFVSTSSQYMFKDVSSIKTNYKSSETSPKSRSFGYMNGYNSTAAKSIENCYYLAVGV